ncbi:hypothetical protein COV11_00995 [Candidatus Woesearchaeota archaeon CG10_big_fil_rev_8_21_14_0_10_30_7]|nr:MAG: hypothetical protein COV11_00995 [Candidatus Woesearchaeota archaeon CG10_big_fil_rev_8_21_14_0_10_30_7]
MSEINISDLNKADVLAVLYNASKPMGLGFMHYDTTPMNREQAQKLLDTGHTEFDYLKGRPMKVVIAGDHMNSEMYDSYHGEGALQKAIESLRSTGQSYNDQVKQTHIAGTKKSIEQLTGSGQLFEPTRVSTHSNMKIYELGMADMLGVLGPKVNEAVKKLDDLKKE